MLPISSAARAPARRLSAGSRPRLLAGVAGALLLGGCAGGMSQQAQQGYDARLGGGDYRGAADFALASGQISPDGTSNNLGWSLDAGAALTYAGEGTRAVPVLDGAERLMKARDLEGLRNMGQYHYATYDGVMANTYKALAFLGTGDRDNARVEFNRLDDRQRRAEEDFAREKARLDAEMAARGRSSGVDVGAMMRGATASADYQRAIDDVHAYASYQPFINPLSTYLYGLFMITDGGTRADVDKGRRALREVRGILGGSPLVDADLALADAPARTPHTWVIFENGRAPSFIEYRITVPVPLLGRSGGVSAVTVALPRMIFHTGTYGGLRVDAGANSVATATIGSFDNVMASEFERRLPRIMAAAALEATLKVGMMEAAAQVKSPLLNLAAAVIGNIATADTRSWTALPKEFEAARVNTPTDGRIHIRTANGADLGTVKVPAGKSSIVYVKAMTPGVPAAIQVLPL